MSKSFQTSMLIAAGVYLAAGLTLIVWPEQARLVICYVLGAAALLYGLVRIGLYFTHRDETPISRYSVALGLACVVLGLFLLFRANAVVAALAGVVGVVVIVTSVLRLQVALDLRRVSGSYWLVICLTALAMLILGVLLLFNPFKVVKAATIVAGVCLLLDGGLTIWTFIEAKKYLSPRSAVTLR